MAMTLSSLLRNLASVGESGIQKYMSTATNTVMTPKKRKMIYTEVLVAKVEAAD
jgi:hypothetical protein